VTRLVLTFHDISDNRSVLSFPPIAFRRLIESLVRRQVPILTFEELLHARHGVTLTFDDGMASVCGEALPVMRASGARGHLFLAAGAVGTGRKWKYGPSGDAPPAMLDWRQAEKCVQGGISIEAHTFSHPDLRSMSDVDIVGECRTGDAAIERHLGRRPAMFAYPYGRLDERVAAAVSPLYSACFTTRFGAVGTNVDLSRVPRVDSYYLQPAWLHRNPTSLPALAYLAARGILRAIRGSA
jgi:peptidoglycan/xylan/chitin deacetylase (PgdA/CDA1 family)